MASTPSPVPKSADPAVIINANAAAAAAINGSSSLTPQRLTPMEPPKLNQRGQNKPKCIKCGNVARSRCPFQSCKNCCAKAQNPCHIHVLKQSSILPDKAPPSTTPLPEQPSSDTPSTGASWRLSSLRQLSAAFANSMRAKKPLTRKDYININKWRFLKLREHIEGNIEAEKEAFDRYILNLSLLEETFSTDGSTISDGKPVPEPTSEEFQKLVSSIKVKVKSKVKKSDSCRKRTRILVSQLLKTLEKSDLQDENSNDPKKLKKGVWRAERNDAFNDLIDKLSKAGTEDDLKYISEMKVRLLNPSEGKAIDSSGAVDSTKALLPEQEPHSSTDLSFFSLPKMCTVVTTNEEVLSKINAEVTSLCQLA